MNSKIPLLKDPETKKLGFFFLKLFLIWLSWKILFLGLGEESMPINERLFPYISIPWETFNYNLVRFILEQSTNLLKLFGFEAYSLDRMIWVQGAKGIVLGNYCLGLQLIYYYILLIVITPMPLKSKLLAIPVGIIITISINIIRTAALSLVLLFTPKYIDIAHDHIFNVLVFGSLMWYYYFLTKKIHD